MTRRHLSARTAIGPMAATRRCARPAARANVENFASLSYLRSSVRGFEIIGILFWIWMIIECARREPPGTVQKAGWLLLVILVPDIGSLIYFLCRVVR